MTQHFARLIEDVKSIFGGTRTKPYYYGREGEKVTIISEGPDMSIVENEKGQRYSVRTSKLEKI